MFFRLSHDTGRCDWQQFMALRKSISWRSEEAHGVLNVAKEPYSANESDLFSSKNCISTRNFGRQDMPFLGISATRLRANYGAPFSSPGNESVAPSCCTQL